MEDVAALFLVFLPLLWKAGPTAKGPPHIPLSLNWNLPDSSMWIFTTTLGLEGPEFSSCFLAFASSCTWTDLSTFFPFLVSFTFPLPPAFHHPWMNGLCNFNCCILCICCYCFSVKHIHWMWEVKEHSHCSRPLPL